MIRAPGLDRQPRVRVRAHEAVAKQLRQPHVGAALGGDDRGEAVDDPARSVDTATVGEHLDANVRDRLRGERRGP